MDQGLWHRTWGSDQDHSQEKEMQKKEKWLCKEYWSFSFSFSPSKEHPGLISFRMDWLDLLAVQGILKSLVQHHSSKASILQCSAFFIVQLSHPYMTTGKTIRWSRSVMSDSLWPCEPQHARPPCPSPTPSVHQTHVHWVSDAIQPSHALSSSSSPVLNVFQHQGLFRWVGSSHLVAKVLEFQL